MCVISINIKLIITLNYNNCNLKAMHRTTNSLYIAEYYIVLGTNI